MTPSADSKLRCLLTRGLATLGVFHARLFAAQTASVITRGKAPRSGFAPAAASAAASASSCSSGARCVCTVETSVEMTAVDFCFYHIVRSRPSLTAEHTFLASCTDTAQRPCAQRRAGRPRPVKKCTFMSHAAHDSHNRIILHRAANVSVAQSVSPSLRS